MVLVLFLVIFGIYTAWRTHHGSTDFDTYYYAAKDVLSGVFIYSEHDGLSPYIYPPFFACLLTPLTLFGIEIASFIWYVLNLAFLFLSLYLCARLIFKEKKINLAQKSLPLLPTILFLIVTFAIFIDNISMLQANILLFSLVLSGIYFFSRKLDVLAGLFLGMAISIKVVPIVFLIYFIFKREFKTCVFIVLWALVFSFAVPSLCMGMGDAVWALIVWNKSMLLKSISGIPGSDMLIVMFNPQNQSIAAFFSRWLIKNDFLILSFKRSAHEYYPFLMTWSFSTKAEYAVFLSKVTTFFIAVLTFFYCRKKINDRESYLLNYEYSLMFLLSLMISPILKIQHMVFLIFPSFFVLSRISRLRENYRFFYVSFVLFALFYLSQACKLFKILGFGTISILLLWFIVLMKYRGRLSGRGSI